MWNSPITVDEESIGTGASYQDDPSSLCGCGQGANSVTAHLRINSPHNLMWVPYFAPPCNGWKDQGSFWRCLRPERRLSPLSHSHSDWDPDLPRVEGNVEMFWNSSLCDCLQKWHFSRFTRQLFTFQSQLRESWHIYDALKKETTWIAAIGVEKCGNWDFTCGFKILLSAVIICGLDNERPHFTWRRTLYQLLLL